MDPSHRDLPDLDAEAQRRVVCRAMRIGIWVWPSFALLDAWMCFVAYPGAPFGLFLLYRLAVELGFVVIYRATARPEVPVERLRYGQDRVTLSFVLTGVTPPKPWITAETAVEAVPPPARGLPSR